MPIAAYLREARANLERAAVELKTDANSLRQQADQQERDAKRRIDELRTEMRNLQNSVTDPNTDAATKAAAGSSIQAITREISEIEHNMAADKQQMLQTAQNMENESNNLSQLAADMERRAAAS